MECKIVRLLQDGSGAVNGAVGFWRESGSFVTFGAKAVVLATGGVGKMWKFTSNSWESTGDGIALALWAGADLIDMECIQFHPTGMVWPPSARGLLVTEGVRGDGGVLAEPRRRAVHVQLHPAFLRRRDGRLDRGGRPVVRRTSGTSAVRRSCCPATRSPGRSTPR